MRTITFNIKYFGVHSDNKISWRLHVESKINKSSGLLLQCKLAFGSKCCAYPKYLIWICLVEICTIRK